MHMHTYIKLSLISSMKKKPSGNSALKHEIAMVIIQGKFPLPMDNHS